MDFGDARTKLPLGMLKTKTDGLNVIAIPSLAMDHNLPTGHGRQHEV